MEFSILHFPLPLFWPKNLTRNNREMGGLMDFPGEATPRPYPLVSLVLARGVTGM